MEYQIQLDRSFEVITASHRTKRAALVVAIAAALFVLYFMRLGSYPLIDADEPIYGRFAVEMASGGDWITPHYFGKLWFDKPPMFYWESAACIRLFGPNEFGCRFPSAVLAVGLVGLVYLLAAHDFGKRAGWVSAIVAATCFEQIILAHAAVTDMTLAFCLIASLYAYRRWFDASGRARFGWMALCGAMMGFGMLTKGPVAIVLLGVTFIVQLGWERQLRRLFGLDVLLGIVALAIIGFPWYIAMLRLHHDAFVQGFLQQNNITRFLRPEHGSQTGAWYSHFINIPILFGLFFPWSLFIIPAIWAKWRANAGARLLAVWFVVVFVFFSLSSTVLPTYIFPAFPACAIFVGAFLAVSASGSIGVVITARRALCVGLAFCLLMIATALTEGGHSRYPEAVPVAVSLFGILAVTMAWALIMVARPKSGEPVKAVWTVGVGMILFAGWLMIAGAPVIGRSRSSQVLAAGVPSGIGADLMDWGLSRPSIEFYLQRPVQHDQDAAAIRQRLMGDKPVLVFCKPKDLDQIKVPGAFEWARSSEVVVVGNRAAGHLEKWRAK